ncbi:PEP-CTERM sorting domain-containing protein [Pyrinomonas methylaliphatogenes]|uniref:PEP-CTERM putative exosortase interaction domain-containing protein n=1 Tax=Pyrinomonas methylaliphatogenes TaxID=454194 RepID=A0A0B6WW05_9BACT|nr:PEP-CTERM sorting domain-containing protein [Pyrinomonas methylaliphatogenes]CDM65453.1 PEP-CTERM putative exosortase interaction domain-containing protein [Pyrinomonas methylaliphatogenes]
MLQRFAFGFLTLLLAVAVGGSTARADFITISQPTAAYTSSTTNIPITDPDYTNITSLSDGTMTLSFSSQVQTRTVPNSWSTWGSPPFTESSTPRVLSSCIGCGNLTITLSQPASIFGFEAEPNNFGVYNITASFYQGATLVGTISQLVNGRSGARLFAAQTSTNPFTTVVIQADSGADGFAIAQLRYSLQSPQPAPVPEPTTMLLLGTGLAGVAGALRRRRRQRE